MIVYTKKDMIPYVDNVRKEIGSGERQKCKALSLNKVFSIKLIKTSNLLTCLEKQNLHDFCSACQQN